MESLRIMFLDCRLAVLPPHIMRFILERRRLSNILRRSGYPGRHSTIRADVGNFNINIRDSIYIFERDRRKEYLQSIRVDSRTYDREERFAGLSVRDPVGGLIDVDGVRIFDDQRKL